MEKVMKRVLLFCSAVALALGASADVVTNPPAVAALLDRVGGTGTADRIEVVVDDSYGTPAAEKFMLTSKNGKPCVKATTLSAATAGIGWYLNHHANVNIAWNNPTTDLSATEFPLPATEEHTTSAAYRYYLNYCTFSYSMSTWTWERWQQEIDWMALRGVNMPLQIIGLEEVWRKLLTEDYGYSKSEANAFVGGPSFMAWFAMNNLEGHGGPNPDWWYERQAKLGRRINERMKSLGIEPVLPGFAGMVPTNFTSKTGIAAKGQGNWSGGFVRPYILTPASDDFNAVAAKYYAKLAEVMGTSKFYSMDPFHEGGGATGGVDAKVAYKSIYDALNSAVPDAGWILQQWQFAGGQWRVFDEGVVPKGKLIVLDLNSDAKPGNLNSYNGHETVYCTIFNFGGRTGFFGRFNGIIDGYFDNKARYQSINGIGAAPEAIEQTPVMYDLLFELPWLDSKPDPAAWMADYARRRYSAESAPAAEAWELLRTSALDCRTALQGPHEAIMCARPALTVNSVSTWGGSEIFYDQTKTATAAYKLLDADLRGENYSYDLTDISRQALTDYSKSLLAGIKDANDRGDSEAFALRRDAFLQLMLDVDRLLNTNKDFMVGHWTERARAMADEVEGTTDADRDWLEHQNARTLITTWSNNNSNLHDYSYRQWGGILRDLYRERWARWFANGMSGVNFFEMESAWAKTDTKRYPTEPEGVTADVARELLTKYLSPLVSAAEGGETRYIQRMLSTDLRGKFYDRAKRGAAYAPNFPVTGILEIDLNKSTTIEPEERSETGSFMIPADAPIGERNVRLVLEDGTEVQYTLLIIEEITEPRTVSVATSDASRGSVSINGTDALTVTGTDFYTLRAKATPLFDFSHWTDASGADAGNDNPMTYYGKEDASFTAHFTENKWGVPQTTPDPETIAQYNQWVKALKLTQNGETTVLTSSETPGEEQFIPVSRRIKAAPGAEFTLSWDNPGGMNWLFLTAWCDFDANGVFEPEKSELVGTLGKHDTKDDTSLANGELKVVLPFDLEPGTTTHLRLRFDSAWFNPRDPQTGAVPADAEVQRYCYELLLEVTDGAEYATLVTCGVNDPALGAVRSENASTNIYLPGGEDVIITAFPGKFARLLRFVDNHGRELPASWVSADAVRFRAYDNAHITAVFEKLPVEVDGWSFDWQTRPDAKGHLTAVISEGETTLDLSEAHCGIAIDRIAPEVFAGNATLRELTLPEGPLTADGARLHTQKVTGNGTQNKQYTLAETISGTTPWILTLEGKTGENSYNEWGSALMANGSNATASDYSKGWWQLYLTKAGTLDVKWDSANAVHFSVNLLGDFSIRAEFDGDKTLTVTCSNADGDSETKVINNSATMQPISRYVTCIPRGMSYTVTFRGEDTDADLASLTAGCPSLMNIHLAAASDVYREKDGVIYNRTGRNVVSYPEGRLHRRPFRIDGVLHRLCAEGLENLETQTVIPGTYSLYYRSGLPKLTIGDSSERLTFEEPLTELPVPAGGVAMPVTVAPGRVQTYIVSALDARGATLTPLAADAEIPAGAGVLTAGGSLPVVDFPEGTALEGNLLRGTILPLEAEGYVVDSFGTFTRTASIPAATAYIPGSYDMGDSFGIAEITAIDAVLAPEGERQLFDLSGRRVGASPRPGLYIDARGAKILIR